MLELVTINVTGEKPEGLGTMQYKSMPRIGEWVALDIDGIGTMFEVVMVAHSPKNAGSDIFIRRLAEHIEAHDSLCSLGT